MPRPGQAARKNHHGNRHENGLVVPGKKVTKQKSNGHLNGNLGVGQHQANVPSHPSNNNVPGEESMPSAGDMKLNGAAGMPKFEPNGRVSANEYGGMPNGTPCSSAVINGVMSGAKMEDQKSLRTDKSGGAAPALKKSPSTSVNPFHLASTILKSCPMYDTIAILIFLLQLPPIVLTLVQFLFASLTFMPPAGVSTGSLTSNFDIFQGPAGTPSLGTMIAMDGFCLLVWGLFMWTWAQNFAIDLAQVQVAITLGGGSSGKNGGVNAFCVMMVLVVHLLRSSGVQDFVIGHLLSAKIISTDTLSRYSHVFPLDLRHKEPPSPPSWIRSLLAVHILAQAGTAMARRSMAKNRSPPPSRTGKRADTEASAGAQTQIDSSAFESTTSFSSAIGPDGTIISPPTVMKENRERITGTKKRRRQANQVRSRQPFWAALASTKVTVMREYENSRNGSWSPFTHPVTEDDVEDASLGGGYIWITHVDSSLIKFAASDFALADDTAASMDTLYDTGCGNVTNKPFYVRVNGAYWATVTLRHVPKDPDNASLVRWRGEISGLAPDCAYTCSFVRSDTEEEICVMSVKTPHAPDTDQVLSIPSVSPSPRQTLRPSSPTTTIKNSIVNAEAKLNERRSRLKKSKNDHKIQVSKVRKELDNFNNRLNSGGDESRQKQRSLQLERNIRQTEEATAVIDVQLDSLEKIPEEELEEWNSRKAAFDQELERTKSAKTDLDTAKSAASRDITSAQSELASIVQKRERLQSRRTRLTEQHERITAANNQGLNERERRAAEQLAREREQARIEEAFHEQITSITGSVQDYQVRINQLWQQAAAIEQAWQQQQHQQMLLNAGPLTPEGELPGTNPQPPEAAASPAPPVMNRSHSRLSYPPFSHDKMGIAGYRTSMSPISGTPLVASPEQHHRQYPASPTNATIGPDLGDYRGRSLSNLSGNSMSGEFGGPLYSSELYDVMAEASRRPLSGAANFSNSISTVNRAGSRNSGSGSGSGSGGGSGSASPHSFRGKAVWS